MRTKASFGAHVIVVGLLAACGDPDGRTDGADRSTTSTSSSTTLPSTTSPSTTPPSTTPSPTTSSSTETSVRRSTTVATEPPEEFEWSLPLGDTSVSNNETELYRTMRDGQCAHAQETLDRLWHGLTSPQNVLLYQAAVHFCAGRTNEGTSAFRAGDKQFGFRGVHTQELDCNVYRAAASIVHRKPQESITCPDGTPPRWPPGGADTRDDPRTPTDESTTSTTSTSSTTRPASATG